MNMFDRLLPVGPRSVLLGAHLWCVHPFFVAAAWTKLYGFPRDPRLWIAFFVHDLGYLFQWCKNMDGAEGESHVEWGANLMERWFGSEWGNFCRFHSRFYAKQAGKPFSRLCVADKLSVCLEPWWLYLPRAIASGEIDEYLALAGGKNGSKYAGEPHSVHVQAQLALGTKRAWFTATTLYMHDWVEQHKHGGEDTWTPRRPV